MKVFPESDRPRITFLLVLSLQEDLGLVLFGELVAVKELSSVHHVVIIENGLLGVHYLGHLDDLLAFLPLRLEIGVRVYHLEYLCFCYLIKFKIADF